MGELEMTGAQLRELGKDALDLVAGFIDEIRERDAIDPLGLEDRFYERPALVEEPGTAQDALEITRAAAQPGIETAGPRFFGYIPAGGIPSSAVASLIAGVFNRYPTIADAAPGMTAIEETVLDWMAREFDLPEGAGGLLTTGGSTATLSAIVAARQSRLGKDLTGARIYASAHTHLCVSKAARIAGLPRTALRGVPVDAELRIDPAAAHEMIEEDRRAGLRPFLLVGNAGTTDTGTIDPLVELAALARESGLWFHVDGAYGGAFQLTERGRARLKGIAKADSIVLDPHKGLFLPYGAGALLVRDPQYLVDAHSETGPYLQDLASTSGLPDYADRGAELTREHRGLRLWLPLRLHGIGAFRRKLDELLDLTELAYQELSSDPAFEVPWRPDLSTFAVRLAAGDDATRALFDAIRSERRLLLTSTTIGGSFYIRLSLLSFRTRREDVEELVVRLRAG